MESFYMMLGIYMIYSTVHFSIIQAKKVWDDRTQWEKIVTVSSIVTTALLMIAAMDK